jgi:hypothetical protein
MAMNKKILLIVIVVAAVLIVAYVNVQIHEKPVFRGHKNVTATPKAPLKPFKMPLPEMKGGLKSIINGSYPVLHRN